MKNPNIFLAAIFVMSIFCVSAGHAKPLETLENMQKAYVVEANAFNRYGKFADQAEKEGYPIVAKLFRSVAFSEIIHSRNHAAAIEGLGGSPQKFELAHVKVGSSAQDNLENAARDERQDQIAMYTRYIEQASTDGLRNAQESFRFAANSENQHKKLFTKGLILLGPKDVDYYVDVKDGDIAEVAPGGGAPKSKFVDGAYVKAAY